MTKPNCEHHPTEIAKYNGSLMELATDIGDLHYERLNELLNFLGDKLEADAKKDHAAGRERLASDLSKASLEIFSASRCISFAWLTSKPFMKQHESKRPNN